MKKVLLLVAAVFSAGMVIKAQTAADAGKETKYRRSSLHLMLIESDNFPSKEIVTKAYNANPFPDKYNNHTITDKSFDPKKYALTAAEKPAKSATENALGAAAQDATGGLVDKDAADMPLIINKYIKQSKLANKLVAKWFNRQSDGTFDTKLIAERGIFDASYIDQKTSEASSEGISLLTNAGNELIPNTFVIFTKMNYYPNEPVAALIRDAAKLKAQDIKMDMLRQKAMEAADLAYEKAKEGYSVWTKAYLYQLKWNDTIRSMFYKDYYMKTGKADPAKKAAFDNSDLFTMDFVGEQNSVSLVTFSLKESRTEQQIIELATKRNVDKVFAKLQKKFEVFKTKTPLFTADPITAKIGLKEGIEAGDKFEVLENNIDPATGKSEYKKVGTIKVKKDMIWDNMAGAELNPVDPNKPAVDRTTFDGKSKNLYPGLLIRQTN